MNISITKEVTISEKINVLKLEVRRTTNKDVDSVNIEISYKNNIIGYGHINNRTNFAHIDLLQENSDLEYYLVYAIENRIIQIQ